MEHLTGSLSETIRYFGTRSDANLRWVTKFDNVDALLALPHNGRTRCRFSVNAAPISGRFEGGTARVSGRLVALRKLALPHERGGGGYPVGLVVAPIMPLAGWRDHYTALFDEIQQALDFPCDLTWELITHRFTPGSREVLQGWYPNTALDMSETGRTTKRNKFGGTKYVYERSTMSELRTWFTDEIAARFPQSQLLYWT